MIVVLLVLFRPRPQAPSSAIRWCLQRLDRASEAIQCSEKVAQSERESAAAQAALGETYLALGDVDKARESLRRCLDLNPKDEGLRRSATELLERADHNRAPELPDGK